MTAAQSPDCRPGNGVCASASERTPDRMDVLQHPTGPAAQRLARKALANHGRGAKQQTLRTVAFGPRTIAVLVFFVVLLATCSAIGNGFVGLDDELYVKDKPSAAGLTGPSIAFAFTSVKDLYWHPLAWLSHELDIELYGQNAAGHHATLAASSCLRIASIPSANTSPMAKTA